jgi:spermidine synthase
MLNKLKTHYLPITVFLTGAGVLIIEVVATRILSPYFGNTIFTVSSVLTVVLAALSVGYYIGGRISDIKPDKNIFFGIILLGGLSVLVLYWLQVLFLPSLGNLLPLTFGPLITSVLLFFAPSLLLGMLSPFAIKLAQVQSKDRGLGSVVGSIFFFSTMGSIGGSLAAGYLLVPYFGVGAIILGVGFGLVFLGMIPLLFLGMDRKTSIKVAAIVMILTLGYGFLTPHTDALYDKNGIYEKITIVDGEYEGRDARFLFQDSSASGAIFLDSDDLVYEYTKYYALNEVFTPEVNRALFIGGGAYSMPKAMMDDLPNAHIDALEIEPDLIELGEKYFDLPADRPNLNTPIADGRRFLHDTKDKYDYIFSDVYDSYYSIPMHFTTQEFFQLSYDKLNDNGVFIANVIGSLDQQTPSFLWSEVRTLQTVFPNVYVFGVESSESPEVQNLILVGHKNPKPALLEEAKLNSSDHDVIRSLQTHQVNIHKFDLSNHPVLTDDYAPVESWTGELLRRKN